MKSRQKGDLLEAQFHQYLLDEKAQGRLVFGAYAPQTCEIFRKKKYACNEREIEFDLVIEVRRTGQTAPIPMWSLSVRTTLAPFANPRSSISP